MKYFTREWLNGEYGDKKSESIIKDYEKHLDKISVMLPQNLLKFARQVSIHDGLFQNTILNERESCITIK
ncbi:MAG: hypothetical protein JSV03_04420, partial [Planctomycetota bacterium]